MSNNLSASASLVLVPPVAWVGRQAIGACSYLGRLAWMLHEAVGALVNRLEGERPLGRSVAHELGWMFGLGMPLVAFVHVGLGSFLSMQSYFGGTFVDGTGAVVGVGLIRNMAPLMACLTMAGLLAARITPELRALRRRSEGDHTSLDRAVGVRLIAAMVAGPVVSLWGAMVGVLVGWQVGQTLLGVSTHNFYLMFWDLLWFRDVVGLLFKGLAFGVATGIFACAEGLRGAADAALPEVSGAACRAACFAALAILVINSGWFILVYHAGPAFGPTLLAPPGL